MMLSVMGKGLRPCFKRSANSLANFSTKNFKTLRVTVPKPYVYQVELYRPEKLNAMDFPMWLEIRKCFEELNDDPKCRVAVLSGAGKSFTAGVDLSSLLELITQVGEVDEVARKAKVLHKRILDCQQTISQLEVFNKPVLAAIHSSCIGAGVSLITAADLRYCTKDAWFQVKEVLVGIVADVGTIQRLPKIISESLSRELAYTARKLYANEAYERGLVSQIFDSKEDMIDSVLQIAEDIAAKSPTAIQMIKQSHLFSRDHSIQESLDQIRLWNQLMIQGEDAAKASIALATRQTEKVDYSDY